MRRQVRAASRGAKDVGGDDFDGGDEDGGRAEGFELGGELGGLVAGSGDEDAFVGEGRHWMIVWRRVRQVGMDIWLSGLSAASLSRTVEALTLLEFQG